MAITELSPLILDVQVSLSDLPDDYVTDEQIYFDLKTAKDYMDSIKEDDFDNDDLERQALVRLGAYFTYVNYTSLAERQLGSIPTTMSIKVDALRRIALALVRQVSNLTIGDDLSVDRSAEAGAYPVALVVSKSVWSD